MRTLLVDNHDSYTFNLFQLIAAVNGAEPTVVTNDDPMLGRLGADEFDNVVISPGPGRPQCARDIGFVEDLLYLTELPVLGVCLGHQAIAYLAGAKVGSAPQARHGHLSRITHRGDDLFAGIPAEFTGVRYHSLCVADPLPPDLIATAWAEDDVIMALRHRSLPRWGVQFHPESIKTEHGHRIMGNFAALTERARRAAGQPARADDSGPGNNGDSGHSNGHGNNGQARPEANGHARTETNGRTLHAPAGPNGLRELITASEPFAVPEQFTAPEPGGLRLITERLPTPVDTETMFTEFFGSSPTCFWLDSSLVKPGLSRFSFLGDGSGPLSETLVYRVGDPGVEIHDAHGVRTVTGNAFDVIERRLAELRLAADPGLPFDFTAGYVGYFGYEMKADCGATAAHQAQTPDALWILADRLVAVDHEAGVTYLLACHDGSEQLHDAARGWVDLMLRRLAGLAAAANGGQAAAVTDGTGPGDGPASPASPDGRQPETAAGQPDSVAEWLVRDENGYQADVQECLRQLKLGESYEICLTTQLHLPFEDDDLAFYRRLRRANPAPYAALLRGGGTTVFCSSPERFLRIDRDRRVESKPIKGTAPRHADRTVDARIIEELGSSAKTRAENLMIVDLLRNDLGRLCEVGSVTVERFMAVESYTTVHQLVSTISGQLKPSVSVVECVRRCFPGGSMTGAPKVRTMEIIDRLEPEARGVYSGTLGFLGLSGGADLNIVIRTAVRQGDTLSVGAGGAVVLDSSPQGEYQEMLLKAATPLRAYRPAALTASVPSAEAAS